MMGEIGQGVEAEHGARTLERVQAAKDAVDQSAVVKSAAQVKQSLLDLFKQILGFHEEHLDGVDLAHWPSTLFTTFTNWSG